MKFVFKSQAHPHFLATLGSGLTLWISTALGDNKPPAEAREPDLKQLDLLQEIFSNPNVDDNKIIAAMKNFDKAPVDRSIKDLSNVLKLLVTEQQLSHQSLRIISIAMDKASFLKKRDI